MKIRMSAVLMVLACGIIIGAEQTASKVEEHQIAFTVVDRSTKPETKRSEIAVKTDGPIHLLNGGEFQTDHDGKGLFFGTKVDGSIRDTDRGVKLIELTIELSRKVMADEATSQIVVGDMLKLRTEMKVGESKRIHCGGQQYCILRLD